MVSRRQKQFGLGPTQEKTTGKVFPQKIGKTMWLKLKGWEGKRNVIHIRTLLGQTRTGKNKWMATLKVTCICIGFSS